VVAETLLSALPEVKQAPFNKLPHLRNFLSFFRHNFKDWILGCMKQELQMINEVLFHQRTFVVLF